MYALQYVAVKLVE